MALFHDSRQEQFRSPLGAVPCGTRVRIALQSDGDVARAFLRLWDGEKSRLLPMTKGKLGRFSTTLTAPDQPALWWYDFYAISESGNSLFFGNAADGLGGAGMEWDHQPPSYQLTVYDPAFTPPAYLREGVMYQIFPDRFYREKLPKSSRTDISLHPCWDDLPLVDPDPRSGDNRALDFFGGTLSGIMEKLPYLQDLGVSVLYLNPIFKARSNHRYDTGDYETIDPLLGSEADFKRLAAACEKHGIRLILDGVFSHTGEDSRYFNRNGHYPGVGAYQSKASPYASWYRFTDFPDKYACWWNIPSLPEINKDDASYRTFILGEKGVARRWLHDGASGWRLDVADELPMSFLRTLRKSVKAENAQAALIGEVWEDASNKVAYGKLRSYVLGDTLDSVMNYPLRDAVIRFLTGAIPAGSVVRLVRSLQENYPAPFFYALMNLTGSHDRARILNVLSDHEYNSVAIEKRGEMRLSPEVKALAKERFLKMLAIFLALPGIPSLYYGDEAGMEGARDPFCRCPFPWDHLDGALHAAVRKGLRERRESRVLQTGFLDISAEGEDTLVIVRYARAGLDAFGQPLPDPPFRLRLTRDRTPKNAMDANY